jgi:hypothetical protein
LSSKPTVIRLELTRVPPDRINIVGQDIPSYVIEPVYAARDISLTIDIEQVLSRVTGRHPFSVVNGFRETGQIPANTDKIRILTLSCTGGR